MEQRYLGSSGLRLSVLGLGTRQWGADTDLDEAAEMLDRFVDAGGTSLDVSAGVGDGAEILGRLLLATHRREDFVIMARSGMAGSRVDGDPPPFVGLDVSRRALLGDLDRTLSVLGTDHVDLWLVDGWSDDVPVRETLSALDHALRSGRARYVGVGNYSAWQVARAATLCDDVVAATTEWSLASREPERDLVPACAALGLGVVAWSALGRGVLTGKYREGIPSDSRAATSHLGAFVGARLDAASRRVVDAVVTAADGLGAPPAHVALGWLCARPALSCALVGPRNPAQLLGVLEAPAFVVPAEIAAVLDEVSARP